MKYGQEYTQALASSDFPPDWLPAAVSYRALKKCIKQIQQELKDLGLDPDTLETLDSSFGVHKDADGQPESARFTPELWVAVDRHTGEFLHTGLTTSTRKFLHSRTSSPKLGDTCDSHADDASITSEEQPPALETAKAIEVTWKKIPLTTVSTFFDALDPALESLDQVQETESVRLKHKIEELSKIITLATDPPPDTAKPKTIKSSAKDMRVWRQLFELYTSQPIFFSTFERDHGATSYAVAKSRLQLFSDKLLATRLTKKFRNPASKTALEHFVNLNLDILRIMRFEEINSQAVRKILKKLDKRTHLGASAVYQPGHSGVTAPGVSGPSNGHSLSRIGSGHVLARSIARDMCAEVATNVLVVVPQLDDYLCPICCELAWKPIKLGCCSAVFCIRCIIQLQKTNEGRCPMCRTESVTAADASRIDNDTIEYLKKYFPKEAKIKQLQNQHAAGIDKYGPEFYKNDCLMM